MASQVKRLGDGLDSEAKNRRKSLLLSTFVMKLKRSRYYAASVRDNKNYVRKDDRGYLGTHHSVQWSIAHVSKVVSSLYSVGARGV